MSIWKALLTIACALPLALMACEGTDGCEGSPTSPLCNEDPAVERGDVSIVLTVTGELDLDREVSVTVGERDRVMDAGQTWSFRLTPGDYPVFVDGVKDNCRLESADNSINVVAGQLTESHVTIACDPLGPPTLRVDATLANYLMYEDANSPVETGDLKLGCWAENGGVDDCANILIDFAGIGEAIDGRQVKSAYLRLYATEIPTDPLDRSASYQVAPLLGEWDVRADMTQRPEVGRVVYSAHPPGSLSEPLEWDVTGIVRQWAEGTLDPFGFQLQDDMADAYVEHNPSSDHPAGYAYDHVVTLESEDSFMDPVHCPHLFIEFE